jgi:transcriptional regulator with PAS, ATPase and Fis domain
VGGIKDLKVNTRIIAATNRDLKQAIKEGDFRNDLYYRLQVIPINVPPLRERAEDIPLLVNHFIAIFNREFKKSVKKAGSEVIQILQRYSWPGNVRELKNVIERAILLDAEDALLPAEGASEEPFMRPMSIRDMERILIRNALAETGGNKSQAARILGISRQTLREKTRLYELD